MTTQATTRVGIGSSPLRTDGPAILTGRMRYVDDVTPTGTHHLAIVRSDLAHGRIRGIDTADAAAASGVRLVLTGAEAAAVSGPIPYFIDPAARGGRRTDIRCLAVDTVVYAGQPVAAVLAASRAEAEAAAELVRVDLEPLPFVLDADEALAEDAPRVYGDWPDNVVSSNRYGEGDVEGALAGADVVIEEELRLGRQTTAPIEPRGFVAEWDRFEEVLTVTGSCQNPHQLRWMVSQSLGLPENRVRIITSKIGGSFGLKMQGHPEDVLLPLVARLAGVPVKWIEDRRQTLAPGCREQVHRVRVGAMADGRIVAVADDVVANIGALTAQAGWAMPNMSATTMPSGYRVRNVSVDLRIVVTNKPPQAAARGFGKDAAHFVMERVVDLVARRLGLPPEQVRRVNFIGADEFPYKTATGLNVDSGDFHGLLDKALAAIDVDAVRRRQAEARAAGRFLGLGMAFELTPESSDSPGTLVSGFDTTTVRMDMTGTVSVFTGVTSPGGGNDTGIAQIVAHEIGLPLDAIRVVQGDTAQCPNGFGNFSGRSMVVGGGSAGLAARDVRDTLLVVGARMVEAARADVSIEDGVLRVDGRPEVAVPVSDIATAVLTRAFSVADDVEPRLESTRAYKPGNIDHKPDARGRVQPYPTYSSCFHAAVVEVDPATGVTSVQDYVLVHDCGTMINPTLVEGQAYGAVAMGLGAALTEELVFDSEGRLLSDRFKTYLLPRAADVPEVQMVHQVTPSPFTAYGNKGAGEAGVGGAQAALANAVEDALSPLGVTVDRVPLRPPAVLRLIRGAGR